MAISSALGSSALLPAGLGFRNVLINGEFRINQRAYTSASNLASGAYGFDRWKSTFTNTTLTFTSAPQGQMVTINSGGSVEQVIERGNITAGTFVLSWEGTATGRVYNTGATPPSYAASPIVVTLDGLANVEVEFTASGGTRTLWKPQLERNNQPTPFEQRPVGVELALCQRYYWRMNADATTTRFGAGYCYASNQAITFIQFPQPMRSAPTALEQSGTASHYAVLNSSGGGVPCNAVPAISTGATHSASITWTTSGSLTAGNGTIAFANSTTNAFLAWSAEL
jgi:hypothetical protein